MTEIQPFKIDIPQADIDDLRDRLRRTRWTGELPGQGWDRGVPVDYLQQLAGYWADGFDWRTAEAELNELPQFTTEIDGQTIHFAHVRSDNPEAVPLLLLHDWPASFMIFREVVAPLSRDFHLVIPSIPGVAFSGPLATAGWHAGRIAAAFIELMSRLGYQRYGVQGQGGGAWDAVEIGRQAHERVVGVHVNGHVAFPIGQDGEMDGLTDAEMARLGKLQHFRDDMMGFAIQQSTRPQTLAYGLHDSPVGQLAWIVEKFREWTDPAVELPEDAIGRDNLLANVCLYWFTGTAGSSAGLYFDNAHNPDAWTPREPGIVPTGVALAPTDITIRRFAERDAPVTHWTELEAGGNFLPMEQPDLFVADVRAFFRSLGAIE
ncbi:epoxide hydrolase family protein [Nocardia yamanashiensis]|uniref:epoxide hydrolase family protein n=1 Tax=Nocardia yamanashiensis TaxID=209247 RepID=UPI0008346615|nr:epoxide hydrolase family protein [Nocardia yamanashiensis]